ncbi:GNAT family N-acetyltransferase [Bowmanella denitrificans]|uniref:GNAT family N-acetyltransferase n=1 Tax=Bowmanella denitrificans TaxID=366582 RepID=UPI000C9C9194|nr:GNAT family N-acetyltransferase [Bowmanella denitrificans]
MVNIKPISHDHWPGILDIQDRVYHDVAPESQAVLASKCQASPDTCLVAMNSQDTVLGYVLAHPWPLEQLPKLHHPVQAVTSDNLYLHDLAVCPSAHGQGVAARLLSALQRRSTAKGFASISLVAVQNADGFWLKQGFTRHADVTLCQSYGDTALPMIKTLSAD